MNNQTSSIRKLGPQFICNFKLIIVNVHLQKIILRLLFIFLQYIGKTQSSFFSMSKLLPIKIVPLSEALVAYVALERPHIGM